MSFFILSDNFFDFGPISAIPKGWKESIGFPYAEHHAESFEKKIKKLNTREAGQTLKIIIEAISNQIISFRFPDTLE